MINGAVIGIGSVVILFILSYAYITIKEKVNRNLVSADRYERQKEFTHQSMLITTTNSYSEVFKALSNVFPQNISAGQAFKGGHYKLRYPLGNKLTYEHTPSINAYAGGDYFVGSISFYKKAETLVAITLIEEWKVSSGVARNMGITAMEDFYNKVKTALLTTDTNAQIQYSGVGVTLTTEGLTPLDITVSKKVNGNSKYCTKCGTKNDNDVNFCKSCGENFNLGGNEYEKNIRT